MRSAKRPASLARAAATTYATNATAVVLSLVNVLIVARVLGPTGRGDVAFLIAVAVVTMHLSSLSVQEANANLAGSQPEHRARLATNSVVLAVALSALGACCVAALIAVVPAVGGDVDPALLWIALAAIPPSMLRTYLSYLVQADYGFAATNRAWLAGPVTTVAVNGMLGALGALTVASAMTAWVAGQSLAALIMVVHVHRGTGFGRFHARLARQSLGFGAKAHLGHVTEVGSYRADQWFLGAAAGSRELGYYSIAVSCAEVLFYLPGILVLVQRPDLVRARAGEAAARAARLLRSSLLVVLAPVALLVVAAPLLCTIVFGDEFSRSGDCLRVLALAAFGVTALMLLRNVLTAQRRPLLASSTLAVAFAVTAAVDVALVPSLGGLGAAIGAVAGQLCGGLAAALLFTRVFDARLRDLVPRASDLGWLAQKLRAGLAAAPPTTREAG